MLRGMEKAKRGVDYPTYAEWEVWTLFDNINCVEGLKRLAEVIRMEKKLYTINFLMKIGPSINEKYLKISSL